MAKFKEVVKKPVKAVVKKLELDKLAKNDTVTKVVIPVTSIAAGAIGTSVGAARLINSKKQQAQLSQDYQDLSSKLDRMSNDLESLKEGKKEKSGRRLFKKKEFSIEGGGYLKIPTKKSIIAEGIKKVAEDSKLRSTDVPFENFKTILDDLSASYELNSKPETCISNLCIYQLGDIIVIYTRYLSREQLIKLSNILDSYCNSFENADYSSYVEEPAGTAIIELWTAEDSLAFLIKRLLDSEFKINLLLK